MANFDWPLFKELHMQKISPEKYSALYEALLVNNWIKAEIYLNYILAKGDIDIVRCYQEAKGQQ